ncbi:MAG TPA: hypothetical protein DCS82_07375 [Rhodospirillaceae bacterium]|nr:hypothetical protein [Rhodospirillaceae bacterium]
MFARWYIWLTSTRGFHLSVALYLAGLWIIRTNLFAGTGGDDAEQLVFSQSWALGYGVGNPPLFTWATIVLTGIFGVGVGVVEGLKFLLLAATYCLLYRAGCLLFQDSKNAALAALSPITFYYVGWDSVLGFTHSVALIAVLAGFYFTLLRLDERSGWLDFLALGILGGLGLLTKYNFALIALALLIAAATDATYRKRFASAKFAAACVLAAAIFAPHGVWLLEQSAELGRFAEDRLADKTLISFAAKAVHGIIQALSGAVNFVLPLLAILLGLFFSAFWRAGPLEHENLRHRRILAGAYMLLAGFVLIAILLSGAVKVRDHLFFILILLPLYGFARVEAASLPVRRHHLFAAVIGIVALAIPLVLAGKFLLYPVTKSDTNLHIPYGEIATEIKKAGFDRGTILADGYPYALGGNLRRFFPDARIVSTKHARFRPPLDEKKGQWLIVWSPHKRAGDWAQVMKDLANRYFGAGLPPSLRSRKIAAPTVPSSDQPFELFYYLTEGKGRCR